MDLTLHQMARTLSERDDYAQVMLKHDLEVAFTHINPHLPHECFDQVVLNTEVSL